MWSRKFKCCQGCQTTESPHMAKGYCAPCYLRQYAVARKSELARYKHKWYMQDHAAQLVQRRLYREELWFSGGSCTGGRPE
jgi:hypothetical protein